MEPFHETTELVRLQETLRRSNRRMRRLLENTRAIPWEADARTWRFTYVGPQAEKLLGYPVEKWYEDGFWAQHIHPDDRQHALDFCLKSSRRVRDYEFEYRMIAADGRSLWIHDIVNVVSVNGEPETLQGFMLDTTERRNAEEALRASEAALRRREREYRELAGKLLTAQEEERRRLAREMHDDLSQRLAVLAIDAGKLELQLASSGCPVPEKLCEMREGIVKLSEDVHAISRALHPSLLDDLGLIAAIESECASFSEREGIAVTFEPNDFSVSVPKDVALCIYRITQEGLRNIAKHARADDAHVGLTVVDGTLVLSINDGGTGFDPAQARERGGLGLASMHERVRLIDGDLRVDSQPGQGTMIQVRVPLSGRSR